MSSGDSFSADILAGQGPVGRNVTFGLGRGQRVTPFGFGRGRPVAPGNQEYSVDQSELSLPVGPAASSTPMAPIAPQPTQVVTVESLGGLVADLAKQIGDSIIASLNTMHQPSSTLPQSPGHQSLGITDPSQLMVIVQSDPRAPPYFRGDHTDTFSIHEWEDMMKCYLGRMKCNTRTEVVDLIMARLTGKARDVVKVSLRSHPELDSSEFPTAVFDILKRNFSELTFSSLPMKDFYSTAPRAGEDMMDYWIHLNKAVADECLRRRGKGVEDPSTEVVMMFITHCSDPGLAMSFKLKSPELWTAAEVQERLDDHMTSLRRSTAHAQNAVNVSVCSQSPVAVSSHRPQHSEPHQAPSVIQQSLPHPVSIAPVSAHCQPQSAHMIMNPPQAPPVSPLYPAPATVPVPVTASSSGVELGPQQVVAMFDRVLSMCTASLATGQRGPRQNARPQNQQSSLCRVCSSGDHTTNAHCRFHRLCLNCFRPGHFRHECPNASQSPAVSTSRPSSAPLN